MYSQVFLVGRRLSEHLRFHLKLWGCIPWGQHSEFLWNSLVVVAPTRPLATGHHESVLWKSTQHTAELVAYHGVTPVSKQPCERQKACPAMDLRYCLQRMLQGWRSCASTTHFLVGATDQIKRINYAFGMQSMSQPEWSLEAGAARQEIGEREVCSQVDSLTVRTSIHQLGRRRAAASVLNLQKRAMTFQFTKVRRHSTQIYQQLLHNIVKLPTFQTLPASGGFVFAQASSTGNSELQWAHKFNWFYFHLRQEECHRKLLEVKCHPRNGFSEIMAQVTPRKGKASDCCFIQLLSTPSSHGTSLAKWRISPATGHWLTALGARQWHCTDSSFSSTLRRAPF